MNNNRHRSLLYICARPGVRERAHTQAQIKQCLASSGLPLPSADRVTPVERPSHSRQLLVPREWHALRIRIRIPYACTTITLMDARRLPLWSYVHTDAPRHPCRQTHTSTLSHSICFLTETLYTTRKVLLIRLTRQ